MRPLTFDSHLLPSLPDPAKHAIAYKSPSPCCQEHHPSTCLYSTSSPGCPTPPDRPPRRHKPPSRTLAKLSLLTARALRTLGRGRGLGLSVGMTRAREARFVHDLGGRFGGCRRCRGGSGCQNGRRGAFLPVEGWVHHVRKCFSNH